MSISICQPDPTNQPLNLSLRLATRVIYTLSFPQEEDRLDKLLDDLRSGRGGTSNGVSEDVRRWPVAQRFANLARELAAANDRLSEKEEQIDELKSERSNTRVSFGYYIGKKLKSSLTQPNVHSILPFQVILFIFP